MRTKRERGYRIKVDERTYRALKVAEAHNLSFTIEPRWTKDGLVITLRCERSGPVATEENWRSLT